MTTKHPENREIESAAQMLRMSVRGMQHMFNYDFVHLKLDTLEIAQLHGVHESVVWALRPGRFWVAK